MVEVHLWQKEVKEFRFECLCRFVVEIGQWGAMGDFIDGFAAGTNLSQGCEIGFERSHVRV